MVRDEALIEELLKIVGKKNVITEEGELEKYGSDQSFVQPLKPLLAVRPSNREEVQQIVYLANEKSIPLFPYSSGTNLQGAHIPACRGITVDLSEMKRIHLIDPLSRNVIVEPGVTFAYLQEEVNKYGLRVLTPVGLPANSSVIGTYLECTPLFSWSKYGPWETLTLEVVLPTGEIIGTGQMDIKNSRFPYTWTTPYAVLNRIFLGAQGTLGIVTRAAITVKTLSESAKVFFVGFDDLSTAVESVRRFLTLEVTEEVFVANPLYLSLFLSRGHKGGIPYLRKTFANWILIMVLRGDEEEVQVKTQDLQEVASSLHLDLRGDLPGLPDAEERVLMEISYPAGSLSQSSYRGAWNPISCYTTLKNLSPYIELLYNLAAEYEYPQEDLGFLLLPLNHGATFYFEPSFYRDPFNMEESQKVKVLFMEASTQLIKSGAYFDRPYPLWAKEVYHKAPAYHQKIREIKRLFDPKNILNPGKLGL